MAERKGSEEEWRTTACIFHFVPPTESHCPDCLKPLCSTPNTLTYLLFLFFWTCLVPPAAQCPIEANIQYYFNYFNTDAYNKRPLLPKRPPGPACTCLLRNYIVGVSDLSLLTCLLGGALNQRSCSVYIAHKDHACRHTIGLALSTTGVISTQRCSIYHTKAKKKKMSTGC